MIVMKFGGTSAQDAAAMANVASIVKSRLAQQPLIVISAIAQATNQLEQIGHLAAEGREGEARDVLLQLITRHNVIVDALITDRERHIELRKTIAGALAELETLIKGIAILRELTPRTMDYVYSFGERLASLLVSSVLNESGIDALWIDTKEFLITDDHFGRARPIMDETEGRLLRIATPLLAAGKVIVTQGFIGVTLKGDRTTMGRESSDFSAALIGAVLGAKDVQIWTDVDGVLTADPLVVSTPKKVRTLSFEEAYELSFFGAKVLHPNTMLPAIERNIPIHVYNTRRPELSGTLITSRSSGASASVKSIAYKKGITVVTVAPRQRLSPYIFWEHIYNILTRNGISPSMTVTAGYNFSIAMDSRNHSDALARELGEIGKVDISQGKGVVSVVGEGIRDKIGVVQRIFSSIADCGVPMISVGASPSNLCFVVDEARVEEIVRRLHAAFFESVDDQETFEVLEHRRA